MILTIEESRNISQRSIVSTLLPPLCASMAVQFLQLNDSQFLASEYLNSISKENQRIFVHLFSTLLGFFCTGKFIRVLEHQDLFGFKTLNAQLTVENT